MPADALHQLYAVTFAPGSANQIQFTPSVERYSRKLVSFEELSLQVRSMRSPLTGVATRLLGAAGTPPPGVVAVAVLDGADSPPALAAVTRNQ